MKATEIVARARSLADIPNSTFISYTDQVESLNESYRDIYSVLVENDDDYYLNEETITLTAGMTSEPGVYIVPLPTDFYKLRYLDKRGDTTWEPMPRFNMGIKDWTNQTPGYRIKNDTLWIVGNIDTGAQVRIGYYPPPPRVTMPDVTLEYAQNVSAANRSLITFPIWVADQRRMVYIYNGTSIISDSYDLRTQVTLVSGLGTPATGLAYRNGYLYYLRASDIWRAPCDFTGTITPVNLTSTGNIQSFSIVQNTLYYYNGTDTKQATLANGSIANYVAGTNVGSIFQYGDTGRGDIRGGQVYINGSSVNAWFAPGASYITSDGTHLYYVVGSKWYKTTLDVTAQTYEAVSSDYGINAIWTYSDGYLPVQTIEYDLSAVSVYDDYDFDYPTNEVNEIMAYQSAIDYRRKQRGDATDLKERLAQLIQRLLTVTKRDEYKPERIQNHYARTSGYAW